MTDLLLVLAAYLLGSISSAIVVCRLMGLPDPRTQGSNNPGATNVLRFGGKKAAFVTLAGDIADRIRANPLAGATYTQTPGADNGCVAEDTDCTIAEMAQHDVFLWRNQAAEFLPAMADGSEQVQVTFDAGANPPTYTITIQWDEPTPEGTAPSYSITVPASSDGTSTVSSSTGSTFLPSISL